MDDDFNTPKAVAALFVLACEINRERDSDPSTASKLASILKRLAGYLGLLERDPDAFLQGAQGEAAGAKGFSVDAIDALIAERLEARANKDWAGSDRIRDELAAQGIVLEDGGGGTTWRRE